MPRKRGPGRPKKVARRAASTAQKSRRRARLRELGLVEFRGWLSPEEARSLGRLSRKTVAHTEYMAALQELGKDGAEPYAERLQTVAAQNDAEIKEENDRRWREKAEADRQVWLANRKRYAQETRPGPAIFSFQGGAFPG